MEESNSIEPWLVELPGKTIGGLRKQGSGTPLVLIHGLFDSSDSWQPLMERYPGACLAVDVPGFGASSRLRDPRISDFAEAITEALRAEGLTHCRVAGHSLGGAIASEIAALYPGMVSELLLIAPAGYGRLPLAEIFDLPLVSTLAQTTMRHAIDHPSVVEFFYRLAVSGGVKPQGSLLERTKSLEMSSVQDAIHALAQSGGESGLRFRRRFYPGPVAAIWGQQDALIPRSHIDHLRQTLPQTDLKILHEVAHHPQAEVPDQVLGFLSQGWKLEQTSKESPDLLPTRRPFGQRIDHLRRKIGPRGSSIRGEAKASISGNDGTRTRGLRRDRPAL
jgi:pimeloyl-ACP methyl ester carboxylesterase